MYESELKAIEDRLEYSTKIREELPRKVTVTYNACVLTDIAALLAEVRRLNRMVDKACERLELLSADDNYGYGKETWRKYLEDAAGNHDQR